MQQQEKFATELETKSKDLINFIKEMETKKITINNNMSQ